MELRRILVPTDFSPCAEQALDWALYLATRSGANLHLLHAVVLFQEDPHDPAHHFPDLEDLHARLTAAAEEAMQAGLAQRDTRHLTVTRAQRRGVSAPGVILDYAAERAVDAIVVGTHGRTGLERLLLGSVAESVVRRAGCPVLTVPGEGGPPPHVERIAVAVDFSDHSPATVAAAAHLARLCGARLEALHVVEEQMHPSFYLTKSSLLDLAPHIVDASREAMAKVLEEAGVDASTAALHVLEGQAARRIVAFAEASGVDLLVLGSHGLTGWEHTLLGSVAEKVVRTSRCPVLTVKPPRRPEA